MSVGTETASAAAQLVIANCSIEVAGNINSSQVTSSDVQKVVKVFVLDFPFALVCFTVFTIYACLWDRQRVHGWIVMAISASFGLQALSIGLRDFAIEVIGWKIIDDAPGFCVFLGLLYHLAYLSSYCWTLVLAFNLWNGVRRMTKMDTKLANTKRFILYAAFGFGVPIMNVIMGSILEWGPGTPAQWNIKRPQYGRTCKVHSSVSFLYLGIPNAILTVPNLAFLGHSFFQLWKTSKITREAGVLSDQQVNMDFARRSFKVFLIMGGLFLIDLVLYFSGFYKKSSYWKLPVETVCRMGIALACAWVFVCNEKVQGQLVEKFPRGIGRLLLRYIK